MSISNVETTTLATTASGSSASTAAYRPLTVTNVVDSLFKHIDKDANGSISLAEVLANVGGRGKTHDTLVATATKLFAHLDTNASGTLNNAEVTAAVKAMDVNGDGNLGFVDLLCGGLRTDMAKLMGVMLTGYEGMDTHW